MERRRGLSDERDSVSVVGAGSTFASGINRCGAGSDGVRRGMKQMMTRHRRRYGDE